MASATRAMFPLRPQPAGDRKPKSISEFIARVNAQHGGFRNVTEERLRKAIEDQAKAALESKDDVDMDANSDGSGEEESTKDMKAVMDEVFKNIDIAHRTAHITLESVSLLLSKELPSQASATITPQLREMVGIGTLGATNLGNSNITTPKLQQNKLMATGRKLLHINKTAESLLSAASRLQKEMDLEIKYWADVLAVSEAGWSVSRLPQERQHMGVKFGFSEASPEFRGNSVAPLRRADDGSVELDWGTIGGDSKRLVVTLEKQGNVVGRSVMADALSQDAALDARVLEARNSVFAQELWHELNREARTLLSYGVELGDDVVSLKFGADFRLLFRLASLEDPTDSIYNFGTQEDDSTARLMTASLHLLLSYAHRQNNHKRSQLNPINVNQNRANQPYILLRPIIAYLTHEQAFAGIVSFVADITSILQAGGFPSVTYTLTEPTVALRNLTLANGTKAASSESLVNALLAPLRFKIELTITPEARLSIVGQTLQGPFISTQYQIQLLPPLTTAQAPSTVASDSVDSTTEANPLIVSCPPTAEPYPSLREVITYVCLAVPRILAERYERLANEWTTTAVAARAPAEVANTDDATPSQIQWIRAMNDVAVMDRDQDTRGVLFSVRMSADDTIHDKPPTSDALSTRERPALYVYSDKMANGKTEHWSWTTDDVAAGVQKESVEDVVRGVIERHVGI